MTDQTPYDEAVALQRDGAGREAITARLRLRGLDDEAIRLLLNAASAHAPAEASPHLEPTPSPSTTTDAVPVPPGATCPRCGTFLEPQKWQRVLGRMYCAPCAARPDVNYPRAWRDERWGKRSGWAWFMGVAALLAFVSGALVLTTSPALAAGLLLSGVGYLLFWSGHPVGRPALVVVTALGTVASVAQGQAPNIFAIVFAVLAMINPRTKLFFKLEIPEAELAAGWLAQHDNLPAQWAAGLGLLSMVSLAALQVSWKFAFGSFGLAAGALVLSVVGLRRVKPDATPPVGRKASALLGGLAGFLGALGAVLGLLRHAGVG